VTRRVCRAAKLTATPPHANRTGPALREGEVAASGLLDLQERQAQSLNPAFMV
jgi:hypothetical protein